MAYWQKTIPAPTDLSIPPISENIGFNPKSVVVDNFTPYWLYIPSTNGYIAPWTTDVVRGFLHATEYPTIIWQSPFETSQPLSADAKFVTFFFTDVSLPASGGILAYGKAQLTTTIPSIDYLASNQASVNDVLQAIYNCTTPMKLSKVTLLNESSLQATLKIVRLNSDIVSGGQIVTPAVLDPSNPAYTGSIAQPPSLDTHPPTTVPTITDTWSHTLPNDIAVGSLILVAFCRKGISTVTTPPAGYTLVNNSSNAASSIVIYGKIATANDSGSTVTTVFTSALTGRIISLCVGSTLTGIVTASSTYSATVNIAVPNVIPTGSNQYIIIISFAQTALTSVTPGTGGQIELVENTNSTGTLWIAYQKHSGVDATTFGNATGAPASTGRTTTLALVVSPLVVNTGPILLTLEPVPAGSTFSFDLSADNIVGRSNAGLAIVSDQYTLPQTIYSRLTQTT